MVCCQLLCEHLGKVARRDVCGPRGDERCVSVSDATDYPALLRIYTNADEALYRTTPSFVAWCMVSELMACQVLTLVYIRS